MEEVLPGVFDWAAFHEGIRSTVHSHYVVSAAALIDPMLPEEGLEWFEGERRPERILLSNRHHYRHSDRFAERFGCPVLCHESGLHEFSAGQGVQGFSFGDEVAPGIVAHEVAAICPDESALHITGSRALALADGAIRNERGSLVFVPDRYIGDDPQGVKRALRASYRLLLELDFESLLMAHGAPFAGDGKDVLAAFASED
jgi:hypothetical protein